MIGIKNRTYVVGMYVQVLIKNGRGEWRRRFGEVFRTYYANTTGDREADKVVGFNLSTTRRYPKAKNNMEVWEINVKTVIDEEKVAVRVEDMHMMCIPYFLQKGETVWDIEGKTSFEVGSVEIKERKALIKLHPKFPVKESEFLYIEINNFSDNYKLDGE